MADTPYFLERQFNSHLNDFADKHISLFAVAPQPLLFKLGTLLNRNFNVDVKQPQKNISDWLWESDIKSLSFIVSESKSQPEEKDVAVVVEVTCGILDEEIIGVCGELKIMRIRTTSFDPKCIKSKLDLSEFVSVYRKVLNQIRCTQPSDTTIHLFTVAPASISVEMGRHWMKGDPGIVLYDRNFDTGQFTKVMSFKKDKKIRRNRFTCTQNNR